MKKLCLFSVVLGIVLVAGCATSYPKGVFYTKLKLPVTATASVSSSPKVGTAECVSYFSMIATGDASIQTAAQSAGITKIHHVDWEVDNILGVIGKYKVTVYGE